MTKSPKDNHRRQTFNGAFAAKAVPYCAVCLEKITWQKQAQMPLRMPAESA